VALDGKASAFPNRSAPSKSGLMLQDRIARYILTERFVRLQAEVERAEKYPTTGDAKALAKRLRLTADGLNDAHRRLGLPHVAAFGDEPGRRRWFRPCLVRRPLARSRRGL
jgi:hypothetical protein